MRTYKLIPVFFVLYKKDWLFQYNQCYKVLLSSGVYNVMLLPRDKSKIDLEIRERLNLYLISNVRKAFFSSFSRTLVLHQHMPYQSSSIRKYLVTRDEILVR